MTSDFASVDKPTPGDIIRARRDAAYWRAVALVGFWINAFLLVIAIYLGSKLHGLWEIAP